MSYIPLGLFALLIAVADQISKYFVVKHIPYGGFVPFGMGPAFDLCTKLRRGLFRF